MSDLIQAGNICPDCGNGMELFHKDPDRETDIYWCKACAGGEHTIEKVEVDSECR